MIRFINFLDKIKNKNVQEHYIDEEFDLITDEIEKSLLEIKEAYDIPTEEINRSVASRRELRKNRKDTFR